jgi:putative salt-induced outer membrane protein
LYGFGKLALESDRIADLDLRSGVEGGLGWKLINTPETLFNLFAGLGWSTDKYGQAQTIGDRTATRFSRTHALIGEESNHQLSASTTFKQRLEIAPGLSGDKATLSRFTAGLAVAMTRTLSLVVNLSNTYNDHPPLGQKRNDTSLFTGINVKFGPP